MCYVCVFSVFFRAGCQLEAPGCNCSGRTWAKKNVACKYVRIAFLYKLMFSCNTPIILATYLLISVSQIFAYCNYFCVCRELKTRTNIHLQPLFHFTNHFKNRVEQWNVIKMKCYWVHLNDQSNLKTKVSLESCGFRKRIRTSAKISLETRVHCDGLFVSLFSCRDFYDTSVWRFSRCDPIARLFSSGWFKKKKKKKNSVI